MPKISGKGSFSDRPPVPSIEENPCQRKITIVIPDSYVSSGKTPKKIYDAGTIELSGKFKGEERDCLN
ncbi:unnamed protein product [Toxocara canis]|uniref:DUF4430 domain-containing protein n=1 Tax=Toxocara canis TaxID=6265 RepID=A0A183U774_TOXCA|nr:unnamed protein product [Toxocara canis]